MSADNYDCNLFRITLRNDPTIEDITEGLAFDVPGHIAYAELRIRAKSIDQALELARKIINSEQPVLILSVKDCD